MQQQTLENQLGEVRHRKKIVDYQVYNNTFLEDEYAKESIENILYDRMKNTLEHMSTLQKNGFLLSSYLEIGAERCQRSLVLENDLGLKGIAADISFDMLKSCDYYHIRFNKKRLPIRVCCDANKLPFLNNSIPFIFCYQTIHHFPDPIPIIQEFYRVLSPGGIFYFNEEPFKKVLHLGLYKSNEVGMKRLSRNILKKVMDYFFEIPSNEFGIVENDNISINEWKKALEIFDIKDIYITNALKLSDNLFFIDNYFKYLILYLLGGNISGVCKKNGLIKNNHFLSMEELFICPDCFEDNEENILYRKEDNIFYCHKCESCFPIIDGVIFLLSSNNFTLLYPELSKFKV